MITDTDVQPSTEEETNYDQSGKSFFPVLIIPGFMSSGLEIVESSLRTKWEGKRLWINLGSLGFHSIHFGGAIKKKREEEDEEEGDEMNQQREYKSLWLQHITLMDDMETEQSGIRVRNLQGLAGVDYLSPGALTSYMSYVFGPVIKALTKVGYVGGQNLDAAPYDWRVTPRVMESRDQYFTNTVRQVENMYDANGGIPLVLLCHSLGCKVGHYFLNFARQSKGQEWLDKYIYSYMPVAGPHLGAPKALRSAISGTKMGLDDFLSDEEAMIFGRSLGSGPWLFPSMLPPGAPSNAIVCKQGCLTIEIVGTINVSPVLKDRKDNDRPSKVKMLIKFGCKSLGSHFVALDEDSGVSFEENLFCFLNKTRQACGRSRIQPFAIGSL